MMPNYLPTNRAVLSAMLAAVAFIMVLTACSPDSLVNVQTPDQIQPSNLTTPAGAQALYAAAIGNFNNYVGGTLNIGANIFGGLLTDELINARPSSEHVDQRAFNNTVFPNLAWDNFSQAYTQLIRARTSLSKYGSSDAPTTTEVGRTFALQGQALTTAGELFCNGVPLSDANDANPHYTVVTNAEMFQRAVAQFDSALAVLSSSALDLPVRQMARVGKARALVDLAQFANAATVVGAGGDGANSQAVPTNFIYNAEYSATSDHNAITDWMIVNPNFGPADKEGINGLNFRSAQDPRVVITGPPRTGQDGITPVYTLQGYSSASTPMRLATGVEARLVEAEAALQGGDVAGFLGALNAARADPGVRANWAITGAGGVDPLPPLTDPGTPAGRVSLLFRERAFWLYMTTHRVGDLRRLVRQYGRDASTVWPTGAYFKGGTYGTDQNITPSAAELNNPVWKGCTDRNP